MSGGELFDKIVNEKYFSEEIACNIMRQLLSAVAYFHEKRIIHRDLFSKKFRRKKRTIIRNSFYITAEILKNEYNEKCHLWSCRAI